MQRIQRLAPAKYWDYVNTVFGNQEILTKETVDAFVKNFVTDNDINWPAVEKIYNSPQERQALLDQVSRTIEVDKAIPAQRVDMALPSGRTFVTTLCGVRADSTGAVVGRVFSADDEIQLKSGSVVVRFAQNVEAVHTSGRGHRR